jgi:hypothetical protein
MANRIPFDLANPDLGLVRQVLFNRLRAEPQWTQLNLKDEKFDAYVEFVGPPSGNHSERFRLLAHEVFWQLIADGIIAPGSDLLNANLPNFRVTRYGRRVLEHGEYQPYDSSGYLQRLRARIPNADDTVIAYVQEALDTFRRRSLVASVVMLGVAAERVFVLLCGSMLKALENPKEEQNFRAEMTRQPMKPKLDRVHKKLQQLQDSNVLGFPENASLAVTGMYDLIRKQRNDLGHPRDTPPSVQPDQAYANLLVFPVYYETTEGIRTYLSGNKI